MTLPRATVASLHACRSRGDSRDCRASVAALHFLPVGSLSLGRHVPTLLPAGRNGIPSPRSADQSSLRDRQTVFADTGRHFSAKSADWSSRRDSRHCQAISRCRSRRLASDPPESAERRQLLRRCCTQLGGHPAPSPARQNSYLSPRKRWSESG